MVEINPERFCLLHGDYRFDNLLFDPDRTSVTVVDWQTITVGLPEEVSPTSSHQPRFRCPGRKRIDLVGVYYRRLLDHGVTHYSASHCWEDTASECCRYRF